MGAHCMWVLASIMGDFRDQETKRSCDTSRYEGQAGAEDRQESKMHPLRPWILSMYLSWALLGLYQEIGKGVLKGLRGQRRLKKLFPVTEWGQNENQQLPLGGGVNVFPLPHSQAQQLPTLPKSGLGGLQAWADATAFFLASCLQWSALPGTRVQSQQKTSTPPLLPVFNPSHRESLSIQRPLSLPGPYAFTQAVSSEEDVRDGLLFFVYLPHLIPKLSPLGGLPNLTCPSSGKRSPSPWASMAPGPSIKYHTLCGLRPSPNGTVSSSSPARGLAI